MTVLFPPSSNKLPGVLAAAMLSFGAIAVFVVSYWFSPRHTDVGYQPVQPVAYSHKLHAGLMGMDCRYCHQKVEESASATIPDAATCMNCHSKVRIDSPELQKIRDAFADENKPVEWVKVHMLPDYAYFNHSMHLGAGIGCVECHGRIDQMEVVRQAEPLSMSWCLDCHRAPDQYIRPRSVPVTDMDYVPDLTKGKAARAERDKLRATPINPPTHCSACHR